MNTDWTEKAAERIIDKFVKYIPTISEEKLVASIIKEEMEKGQEGASCRVDGIAYNSQGGYPVPAKSAESKGSGTRDVAMRELISALEWALDIIKLDEDYLRGHDSENYAKFHNVEAMEIATIQATAALELGKKALSQAPLTRKSDSAPVLTKKSNPWIATATKPPTKVRKL